jgi:hypothetical protein
MLVAFHALLFGLINESIGRYCGHAEDLYLEEGKHGSADLR